ncbi:MAG TPA: hypothetical protein QGF58_13995 [Myxococcota bacterium]|nr:hypothetical protein [Myxococcota bacterium]
MNKIMSKVPDIDSRTGGTIAAAMRVVALSDGLHPREEALIDEFEKSLGTEATAEVDLSVIDTPALREAFLKSLVLVAFADGRISEEESVCIRDYATDLGLGEPEVAKAIADVAAHLLGQLAGVKVFREQVVQLGRNMGLDELTIASVLE